MTKQSKTIYLVHIIVWIVLFLVYCFLAEPITAWLFPGFHDVQMWIVVLFTGQFILFIGMITSCILWHKKKKVKFPLIDRATGKEFKY